MNCDGPEIFSIAYSHDWAAAIADFCRNIMYQFAVRDCAFTVAFGNSFLEGFREFSPPFANLVFECVFVIAEHNQILLRLTVTNFKLHVLREFHRLTELNYCVVVRMSLFSYFKFRRIVETLNFDSFRKSAISFFSADSRIKPVLDKSRSFLLIVEIMSNCQHESGGDEEASSENKRFGIIIFAEG